MKRRVLGLVISAALVVALVVGLTRMGRHGSSVHGVLPEMTSVTAEVTPDARRVEMGRHANVEFPPGVVDRRGLVRLSPSSQADALPGFAPAGAAVHVSLTSANLVGAATVRLDVNPRFRDKHPV